MAKQRQTGDAARRPKWWIVHQHHEVNVMQSESAPSAEVEDGERMKKVYGPYASEQEASTRAEDIYSRTTKAMSERAGW